MAFLWRTATVYLVTLLALTIEDDSAEGEQRFVTVGLIHWAQ